MSNKIIFICSLMILFGCGKEYDCIKTEPDFARLKIYEFTYNGISKRFITGDYGIYESGVVNGVYEIMSRGGCCDVVAKYPIKNTTYEVIKDTVLEVGRNCIEWKEKP